MVRPHVAVITTVEPVHIEFFRSISAIADAKAYLAALTPEQFAGRDDEPVTFTIGNGMAPTLPASASSAAVFTYS